MHLKDYIRVFIEICTDCDRSVPGTRKESFALQSLRLLVRSLHFRMQESIGLDIDAQGHLGTLIYDVSPRCS